MLKTKSEVCLSFEWREDFGKEEAYIRLVLEELSSDEFEPKKKVYI